jgi:hypothetical protein
MGWLDRRHRKRVWNHYHVHTFYMCDVCDKPIPSGGLIVIDPRKGYYPRPAGVSEFVSKEPKWCCHYDCDPIKHRRKRIQAKKKLFVETMTQILHMIRKKPERGYWTKEKCCHKLEGKFERRMVLRAIDQLRKDDRLKKREGGYLIK